MTIKEKILDLIKRLSDCDSDWPASIRAELEKIAAEPELGDFRAARFAAVRDFLAGSLKGKQTAAALKLDIQAAVESLTELCNAKN